MVAAAALRPPPYLPLFRPTQTIPQDTRSSASDSGASSADPEDDSRSPSAFSIRKPSASPSSDRDYFSGSSSKKLPSPSSDSDAYTAKLNGSITQVPEMSPSSIMPPTGIIPRWIPPFHGFGDSSSWRDLWMRPPITLAAPAPDQNEPIDLSVRSSKDTKLSNPASPVREESVKPVVPLDLSLDR